MTTVYKILIALSLTVLLSGAAFADPGDQGRGNRGPGYGHDRLIEKLDLSDAQQTAIEAIHEEVRQETADLRKQLRRLEHARRGEMLEDKPSEKTLIELTEQIGGLRTQMQVIRVKSRLAVRAQLTDEQRDRFPMMGDRGHRRGDGDCDGCGERDRKGGGQRRGRRGR